MWKPAYRAVVAEEQIEELWRLTAEPTLCFDGDAAAAQAAADAHAAANPAPAPAAPADEAPAVEVAAEEAGDVGSWLFSK